MNKQLEDWLNGNPIHDKDSEQCCPDFSCCRGDIVDLATRQRYIRAVKENDERIKMEMLGMFLGRAMSGETKKEIYVAGLEIPHTDISKLEHIESKDCWCEPTLIQAIDDEHDCEVWSHKGHEELNQ